MAKSKTNISLFILAVLFIYSCKHRSENTGDLTKDIPRDSTGINKELQVIDSKIEKEPQNADLYYKKSLLYINKKQVKPAFENIVKALNIDSTKSEYYLPLSDCFFATLQIGRTKRVLEKAIVLDNTNTEALLKLAELYLYVKKHQESIKYVNQALRVNVHLAKAYFIKGMNQKELGDTTRAISSFQTVVEQDPDYYDAFMQLGLLFFFKNNPLAIQYLTSAIALNYKSVEALYARGLYYQKSGEYTKAFSDYDSILKIEPDNSNALYNKGYILFQLQNKPGKAIEYFSKAAKADSTYIDAYKMHAQCLLKTGRGKEAKNDYKIIEKLAKNDK